MVSMNCHIEIGDYEFFLVNSIDVDSSWRSLADTANIMLPNIQDLLKKIKTGMPVLIEMGYDGEWGKEFEGYVSAIKPSVPLHIVCEDEMWKLKQETISKSWRSISLKDMLNEIVPGAVIECPQVTLSPFRLDRVTKARALEIIKDEYGLCAYFRNKKLYVGLPYGEKGLEKVVYHFQKNALIDSLEYRKKEDIKIKVKAISIRPDNTKVEAEVGDQDGEQRTLHFYNKTQGEVKILAEEMLELMKIDGYKGNFKAFGQPFVQHGAVAELQDDAYPERQGNYFVDAVHTFYNDSVGFMRDVSPGKKASA